MGTRDQGTAVRQPYSNGPIRSFRDLVAWQKAYALGLAVYRLTVQMPREERFGLTQQVRRCSVSVSSNIAEGYSRSGRSDYARFLKVARGSLYECDTQLMLCADFEYVSREDNLQVKQILDECERVLAGLIRAIDSDS